MVLRRTRADEVRVWRGYRWLYQVADPAENRNFRRPRRRVAPLPLLFLDPPYHETAGYGIDVADDRYEALAEQLASIREQFIMSINDTPFIRRTFARFRVDEVDTTWTVSSASAGRATKVTELVFRSAQR